MLHIEFITDLGARVTVDVESADKLLDVQRQYGRLGWTSGELPAGGYQFPFDNETDFDWALLGARKYTTPEGEELVYHKGHAYRRRELEPVDSRKMKLPAAVKYSRGAKNSDPDHVREKADGEFEYVTLAIFRGGRRQDRYAVPGGAANAPRTAAAPAQAAQRPRPTAAVAAPRAGAVSVVDEETAPF
ncbi:single-stranded DNA-binding protein [Deinococcus oregonensis]|uniref:Single-stranded DNA-binding protein n=1 Tax=Deinococcus oregonensis TaxID=1805970 RepID=A0ABV6B1R1_9DEIO